MSRLRLQSLSKARQFETWGVKTRDYETPAPVDMLFSEEHTLLKPPPNLRLQLVRDVSLPREGFLWIVRRHYRVLQADGHESAEFIYDTVDRRARDAVVLVAYTSVQGTCSVYLRTALRPPLALRDGTNSPVAESHGAGLWELPAGLIEPTEALDLAGVRRAAVRELQEELGFEVDASQLVELGSSVFPAPGMVAERQFFFFVEVDETARREPDLDGSVLEEGASIALVEIDAALQMCSDGLLPDAKTELGLRRFRDQCRK
jgi:ADP-ribose pyrophosphatase